LGQYLIHTGILLENLKVAPLARPRRRWDDNIKIDIKGKGRPRFDRIYLAQDKDK
jgi:hypothetical protein